MTSEVFLFYIYLLINALFLKRVFVLFQERIPYG